MHWKLYFIIIVVLGTFMKKLEHYASSMCMDQVAIQRVWRGAYSREHVNILKKNKKPSQTSLLPPTTGETYAEVENRVVVVKEEEPSGEQVFALSDDIPWDFVKVRDSCIPQPPPQRIKKMEKQDVLTTGLGAELRS